MSFPVACQIRMQAADPMLPRLGHGVVAERPRRDNRSEERYEHRRARLDALAAQLDHVSHLVNEQQYDEARGEGNAPDPRVGGHRDRHRAHSREQLELRHQQQERLELRQERDDRREHRAERALEP
jgi:hypothetical protein